MPSRPLLSVVITSYTVDRLSDIRDLLVSLKVQTYPCIETVFIAERSADLRDGVRDFAQVCGLTPFRVVFSQEKLGLGGARNLGSRHAEGDIVAFVDDDVVLDPDWAAEMVKSYEDASVIGVTGAAVPLWQDRKLAWLPKELYWLISCTDWTRWSEPGEARSLWGGNMSVRREAFEKAGSFSSVLGYHAPIAEDLEFSLRVKAKTDGKLLFNPKARASHKVHGYRVGFKFISSRSHHIGVSRRLLRKTYFKEQAHFGLERTVLGGMAGTLIKAPRDLFVNPYAAWKRLTTTLTVLVFAGIGYLFPGRALEAAKEIERLSRGGHLET